MPRHTTPVARARIITKLEEGWSIRAAADTFHLNKSSVLKMKKRWELEGTVQREAGSGRQKISTDVEDTQLINYFRENLFHTARDAIVNTNFPGSQPTVCRRVKKSDINNYVAAKKRKLTEENKQSRLLFALNYDLQEIQFWENMVFSDEKMFQSTNDGHVRVYRPRGTRFDENYVKALERSGRFSINTWAWISYHGLRTC
jgi:transposase